MQPGPVAGARQGADAGLLERRGLCQGAFHDLMVLASSRARWTTGRTGLSFIDHFPREENRPLDDHVFPAFLSPAFCDGSSLLERGQVAGGHGRPGADTPHELLFAHRPSHSILWIFLLAAHIQLRETREERLPTLRLIGAGRPATAYAGQLTQVAV